MDGDGNAVEVVSGLDAWFSMRRRSWARRQRRMLSLAWLLLGFTLIVLLIPGITELFLPRTHILHASGMQAIQRWLANLTSLSVISLFFLLSGSCISHCLPGSDMLGPLGNREFHLALRRNCLAICYRLSAQFVLPVLLAGSISQAMVLLHYDMLDDLRPFSRMLGWTLVAILHALIAAQLGLRLPGMAPLLRMLLGLLAVLLAAMLASAPLFVIYMLTENFSMLSDSQTRMLTGWLGPATLGLVVWGLLAWSRQLPPDLIEGLDRHSAMRRS